MSARGCLSGLVAALVVGPALALGAPAHAADEGGPEPGQSDGGRIVKHGWWARSNQPPPETGLLAPPSVPALAAPKGTLPVSQLAGKAERVAALEVSLEGKPDDEVKRVVIVLRESADPTASANAAEAAIVACPVTESYWIGAENGAWGTKPEYDCTAGAVPGVRDDKGVWRFDVTSLAADWLALETGLPPAVVLVGAAAAAEEAASAKAAPAAPAAAAAPAVAAAPAESTSFQVGFDAAKGLGLLARSKAAPPAQDDAEEETDTDDAADDAADDAPESGGTGGTGSSGIGGGGDIGGSAPLDTGGAGDPGSEALSVGAEAPAEEQTGTAAISPMAAPPALSWHDGLGRGALLLLPVVMLLAYLCMVALGPAGQPVAGDGRRGVSRALERLRAARPVTPTPGRTAR